MPTLTIKKIPQDLHDRLKQQAKRNRRSVNSETIVLLERALLTPVIEAETLIHEAEEIDRRLRRSLSSNRVNLAKQEGRL